MEKYTRAFVRGGIVGGILVGALAAVTIIDTKPLMTAQDKLFSIGKYLLSGAYIAGTATATAEMTQDLFAKLFHS